MAVKLYKSLIYLGIASAIGLFVLSNLIDSKFLDENHLVYFSFVWMFPIAVGVYGYSAEKLFSLRKEEYSETLLTSVIKWISGFGGSVFSFLKDIRTLIQSAIIVVSLVPAAIFRNSQNKSYFMMVGILFWYLIYSFILLELY